MPTLTWKGVLALGGVVLVLAFVVEKQAKAAVVTTANAVNPLNNHNIFYTGLSHAVDYVTGSSPDLSLGDQIYNWTHPDNKVQSGQGSLGQ